MQETWLWSLGREDPMEKEMATHSSILAWEIPWTEEPGGLQFMGSQSVWHNWATNTFHFHLTILLNNSTPWYTWMKSSWMKTYHTEICTQMFREHYPWKPESGSHPSVHQWIMGKQNAIHTHHRILSSLKEERTLTQATARKTLEKTTWRETSRSKRTDTVWL